MYIWMYFIQQQWCWWDPQCQGCACWTRWSHGKFEYIPLFWLSHIHHFFALTLHLTATMFNDYLLCYQCREELLSYLHCWIIRRDHQHAGIHRSILSYSRCTIHVTMTSIAGWQQQTSCTCDATRVPLGRESGMATALWTSCRTRAVIICIDFSPFSLCKRNNTIIANSSCYNTKGNQCIPYACSAAGLSVNVHSSVSVNVCTSPSICLTIKLL